LETSLGKDRRYIRSLYWDKLDRLWIGGHNGVDRYDPGSQSYRHFHHNPGNSNSLSNNNVRAIYQDHSGGFWFCTWGGGLDHYNQTTDTFTNFRYQPDNPSSLSNNNVIYILQDSEETFWVATSNGLNRFNLSDESTLDSSQLHFDRFYHDPSNPKSLSNNYVLSIHEAQNGDLWFGTMLGLSHLKKRDRDKPEFTRYFMKNGLPNDVVYGILEDSRGNLWLSTNNGLSCFDPRAETFKNYDMRDGLQSNEFNSGAYAQTAEGTLIFGGVNGATEFHPDSLRDNPYLPPIVMTEFYIFNEPEKLNQTISNIDEIILSYRENYFSFDFASLDFSIPDRNRFAYMLEGLDQDWIYSGNRPFAGYTRVDPGEYVFKVKGTNSDGAWNDAGASVRIIITPPFWKTWWFTLLGILTIGGGIAFLILYRVKRLLEIERLRSKIAANLHDDIGAGLTEISIMGEVIGQKLPQSSKQLISSEIQKIGATSRGLIDNMSDIVWLVNPRRDSLYDLISRLGDSYTSLLDATNIQFKTQNLDTLKNVRLSMEYRQHLFLIFKEAINNSVKYSQGTEIFLNVVLKGKKLKMQLTDNGRGFEPQSAAKGNGLANMKKRAELIKGTLKIKSIIEKGTEIEFEGNIH
jgi:two-component sensor histidine kinase